MLIITYTSSHNHPGPPDVISTANLTQSPPEEPQSKQPSTEQDHDHDHLPVALLPKQQEQPDQDQEHAADHFHYIESPVRYSSQEDPFSGTHDMIMTSSSSGSLGLLLDDHEELHDSQLSYSQLMNFSTPTKSQEENDFFDELEELPTFSSFPFPSFMARTTNLSLETIPSVPS